MKIVLIGFMGSGKTSVTKELSRLLSWPILEMDEMVYQKTNAKTMHEVFAIGGELLLRETEIAIAKEHSQADKLVVSTGAGVIMNKINVDYFKQKNGIIVFLNARLDTIQKRLAHDNTRPLFKNNDDAKSLYDLRQPLYLKYADHVIDVEIAQEIVVGLELKETNHGQ
jgi:shikimate kinase